MIATDFVLLHATIFNRLKRMKGRVMDEILIANTGLSNISLKTSQTNSEFQLSA